MTNNYRYRPERSRGIFKKLTKLFIVLALALIPGVSLAARMVQGTIPQVQPLQPPAVGVHSNPSGNINFHSAVQGFGEANSGTPLAAPTTVNQATANPTANSASVVQAVENHSLAAAIIFVIVVAGVAIGVRKYLR